MVTLLRFRSHGGFPVAPVKSPSPSVPRQILRLVPIVGASFPQPPVCHQSHQFSPGQVMAFSPSQGCVSRVSSRCRSLISHLAEAATDLSDGLCSFSPSRPIRFGRFAQPRARVRPCHSVASASLSAADRPLRSSFSDCGFTLSRLL